MKQTKLRTDYVVENENISFPVGTAIAIQKYSQKLDFDGIFSSLKKRGISIVRLIEALLCYKLTENLSTTRAGDWINRSPVLRQFGLVEFNERALFRVLEKIGEDYEKVLMLLREKLFEKYDFPHTNTNLDWTSLVLWGQHADIGKYGYSRDHRPDKKQITIGIAELANPINIPYGLTIQPGNLNDQSHFKRTYRQIEPHLRDDSRIVFDKGSQSKDNLDMILAGKMKYLSAKKLNLSDDKRIKEFRKEDAELVDAENGVYGVKIDYPSRIDYFYFSERSQQEQIEAKFRRAEQKLIEAREIQESIEKKRNLPKRFQINNPLVDVKYSYQTKLTDLTEQEARKIVQSAALTGREGFFCLISPENLTLLEALKVYREKDSLEKTFQSLKNDINITPLRVWSTNSIHGAVLMGFIAQLIISLIRYDFEELKQTAPKIIKISLANLTVTVEKLKDRAKRWIYSNFEPINTMICCQNEAIT